MRLTTIIPAVAACIGLCAHGSDQKLTSSDLEQGRRYLNQTRLGVIGATKGLSEAQWNFKPSPDRWSIAEIVEHIVLTQELILGPIREQLAKSPVNALSNAKQVDAVVLSQFPNRIQSFHAPDVLKPNGRWTPAVALSRLQVNYDNLIEYLETTPDLRQHTIPAAPLKALTNGAYESMDGYEWILGAAGHAERHTKQILEVKADPAFPAK